MFSVSLAHRPAQFLAPAERQPVDRQADRGRRDETEATAVASNGVKPMKRSLVLHGTNTSISVEEVFWTALEEIAREAERSAICRCESAGEVEDRGRRGGLP